MEPNARYTLVGSIIIGLVTACVIAALWLSKSGNDASFTFFAVYFKEHSLAGLQIDGDVTMKGIKIGSVTSVKILPRDIERAKVIIKIDNETPITVDTTAVVRRNLLTGLAGIDLIPGKEAPLLVVPPGERFPVIGEGKSQLESITNSLPQLLENTNTLVVRATEFFSAENKETFSSILKDVNTLTSSFAGISKLVDDIHDLAESLKGKTEDVSHAISSTSLRVSMEAAKIAESLSDASRSLATTAEQFQDPKRLFLGPKPEELGPGEANKERGR